jgi:hypothetical protein
VNRTGTPIDDSRLRLLADQVHRQAAAAGGEDGLLVGDRLLRSVLRPLEPSETDAKPEADAGLSGPLADQVAELAVLATQGYLAQPSQGMHEAAAALHDLVARIVPDRVQELAGLVASLPQSVVVVSRGPLSDVKRSAGRLARRRDLAVSPCRPVPLRPIATQAVLRRNARRDRLRRREEPDACTGPARSLRRRAGDGARQSRALCALGVCTDRLKSAFHADSEPFVTPSGDGRTSSSRPSAPVHREHSRTPSTASSSATASISSGRQRSK